MTVLGHSPFYGLIFQIPLHLLISIFMSSINSYILSYLCHMVSSSSISLSVSNESTWFIKWRYSMHYSDNHSVLICILTLFAFSPNTAMVQITAPISSCKTLTSHLMEIISCDCHSLAVWESSGSLSSEKFSSSSTHRPLGFSNFTATDFDLWWWVFTNLWTNTFVFPLVERPFSLSNQRSCSTDFHNKASGILLR